jgi:hypothetical protein
VIKVAAFNNKNDFKNRTGYSNKYGAEPKLMTVRQLQYIESLLRNRTVDDNYRDDVSNALKGSLTRYEASKIIDELLNIVLVKNGPQEGSDRNKSDTKIGTMDSEEVKVEKVQDMESDKKTLDKRVMQ